MLYDKRWNRTVAPVKVKIEPWRRLLIKAARILERDGWCRGSYHQGLKSCAVGALQYADNFPLTGTHSPVYFEAHRRLYQFISPGRWGGIESWNDSAKRTSAEVIATMRKVAGE